MQQDGRDDGASSNADATVSGGPPERAHAVGPRGELATSGSELAPGSVIAARYRIVGRLGRGGMGEVYRADDLELGVAVALKFLPVEVASDPVRLERLRREVRLARQVTHPNVCRVHDIGAAEGRAFLSMEFIDGEDLASLLRRIGRLPEDKAVELAGQICAGLAAAHEHDLVHCDLKPANVMIDGRGRARLTDFGLAAAARDARDGPEAFAGTPAYMAPEQLAGVRATRRSDIYALGLVLYELFTGKCAFQAAGLAQLRELRGSASPPSSPRELVAGLDPDVDSAIMACLESDPTDRPPSALAVLAALPGRDPLRAMVEAGETPSPELVAASGRRGTLAPKQVLQLVALILGGLIFNWRLPGFGSIERAVGEILAPPVLEHRARELLVALGDRGGAVDSALGFDLDPLALARLKGLAREARRHVLGSDGRPVLRFWYRQSPVPLMPWRATLPGAALSAGTVTPDDPPLLVPGMALVRLGLRGRLLELRVVGSERDSVTLTPDESAERLGALLVAAGASLQEARDVVDGNPVPSQGSWRTVLSDPDGSAKLVVEALLTDGRPTWFRTESDGEGDATGARGASQLSVFVDVQNLTVFVFLLGGAVFALVNVRSGRWDRRGAARLALAAFVLCGASVVIGGHHTLVAAEEARLVFMAVAYGSTRAVLTWLLYVAIEPLIRRSHPTSLVSWTRLLSGRPGDPAVGRDVLVGLASAQVLLGACMVWTWARGWVGATLPFMALSEGGNPLGTANALMIMLRSPVVAVGTGLGFLLVYVVVRGLLGRSRNAGPILLAGLISLFVFFGVEWGLDPVDRVAMALITASVWAALAVRSGLLAFATCITVVQIVSEVVLSPNPGAWFAGPSLLFVTFVLLLTAIGFRTSLGGTRLVAPSR